MMRVSHTCCLKKPTFIFGMVQTKEDTEFFLSVLAFDFTMNIFLLSRIQVHIWDAQGSTSGAHLQSSALNSVDHECIRLFIENLFCATYYFRCTILANEIN